VWGPVVGLWKGIELAFSKYIIKIIIALIDTIFIYWARNWNMVDKDWNESL